MSLYTQSVQGRGVARPTEEEYAMDYPYIITAPAPSRQQNALRVEIIPPQDRCALRPTTDFAAIIRARFQWRTDQLSRLWDDFDYCTRPTGGCRVCPFYRQHLDRPHAPKDAVVRHDPVKASVWWILPSADDGWERFGYFYANNGLARILNNWRVDIDPERKQDRHGSYWQLVEDAERA